MNEIVFTADEVKYLRAGLGKLPHDDVAELIYLVMTAVKRNADAAQTAAGSTESNDAESHKTAKAE